MNWSALDIIEWLFVNFPEITAILVDNETGEVTLYGIDEEFCDLYPSTVMPDFSTDPTQTLYQRFTSYGDFVSITVLNDEDVDDLFWDERGYFDFENEPK